MKFYYGWAWIFILEVFPETSPPMKVRQWWLKAREELPISKYYAISAKWWNFMLLKQKEKQTCIQILIQCIKTETQYTWTCIKYMRIFINIIMIMHCHNGLICCYVLYCMLSPSIAIAVQYLYINHKQVTFLVLGPSPVICLPSRYVNVCCYAK